MLFVLLSASSLAGCDEQDTAPKTLIFDRVYDLGELPADAHPPAASDADLRPWADIEAEVAEKLERHARRTNGTDAAASHLLSELRSETRASAAPFAPAEGSFARAESIGSIEQCVSVHESSRSLDPSQLDLVGEFEFTLSTPIPEDVDIIAPPPVNDEFWFVEHCTLGGYQNRFFQCSEVDARVDLRPFTDFATGVIRRNAGVFLTETRAMVITEVTTACEGSECDDSLAETLALAENMPCTDYILTPAEVLPE